MLGQHYSSEAEFPKRMTRGKIKRGLLLSARIDDLSSTDVSGKADLASRTTATPSTADRKPEWR